MAWPMIAAFAAMAAGAAVTAGGAYQSGVSSKRLANYNAKVAEMEGLAAAQDARSNARSTQNRTRQALGMQRNIAATSGVTSTSFGRLEDQSAIAGALDALKIRYGGLSAGVASQNAAALARKSGRAAMRGGLYGSIGTLLTGSASAAQSYSAMRQPTVQQPTGQQTNVNRDSVMKPS